MDNFFYNITAIVVGVILVFLDVYYYKNKRVLLGVILSIHTVLFIGTGIGGFFVPEAYGIVPIIVLLTLTVTMIFTLLLCKNDNHADKSK